MTSREEWIKDMRAALDFLEQHPELPQPNCTDELTWYYWDSNDEPKVRMFARAFRTFEKKFSEYSLRLEKKFGKIKLIVSINRQGVCSMTQVGTKTEVRSVAIGYENKEVTVPVYEYDCPALLAPLADPEDPE